MKKLTFIFLFAAACLSAKAVNVSGNITGSHTWTLANSPYVVTGSVNILQGATLTIENGVEVRFADGVNLSNNGTLNANNVSFTSNTGTTPGKWQGLYFNAGSTSNLTNISVRYAEYPLRLESGVCVLNVSGNNTFEANTYQGVSWYFGTINSNFSLPKLPIPYLVTNKNITNGAKLTIAPGAVLKFRQGGYLHVINNGSIHAVGTEAEPILITSVCDAEAGGYTESGGVFPGLWHNIGIYSGTADDNQFAYCIIGKTNCTKFENKLYIFPRGERKIFSC